MMAQGSLWRAAANIFQAWFVEGLWASLWRVCGGFIGAFMESLRVSLWRVYERVHEEFMEGLSRVYREFVRSLWTV